MRNLFHYLFKRLKLVALLDLAPHSKNSELLLKQSLVKFKEGIPGKPVLTVKTVIKPKCKYFPSTEYLTPALARAFSCLTLASYLNSAVHNLPED